MSSSSSKQLDLFEDAPSSAITNSKCDYYFDTIISEFNLDVHLPYAQTSSLPNSFISSGFKCLVFNETVQKSIMCFKRFISEIKDPFKTHNLPSWQRRVVVSNGIDVDFFADVDLPEKIYGIDNASVLLCPSKMWEKHNDFLSTIFF